MGGNGKEVEERDEEGRRRGGGGEGWEARERWNVCAVVTVHI